MIASRCNQVGTCMCNFKTVHENKVLINTPIIELQELPTLTDILNNLENYILSLDRYDSYSGEAPVRDEEGEYIKLEDVLKLFGAGK